MSLLREKPEKVGRGRCDGNFEEKLCKEVVACTSRGGAGKRLELAVAANPEKSTLVRPL